MRKLVEVDFDGVEYQTPMAYLINFGDKQVWIPKGQVEEMNEEDGTMLISYWLAKCEGLI